MKRKKKKKILASSPSIFLFFILLKPIKNCYKGEWTIINLACGKIKLVFKEEGSKLPIQKNSRPTCFFCHPQIIPTKFSQEQKEK
jgi:hypothetical protein